jgi:arylsulfatase A-like enzyme
MKFLPPISALLSILVAAAPVQGAEESRPNIIFILTDDFGWSDAECYGNQFHETPNIDRLARAGMRFTNFHTASPVCSPTRASILTGLYAERLGMTQPAAHIELVNLKAYLPKQADAGDKVVEPKSTTRLDTSFPTLAKALQSAGYHTGHLGKWHLGLPPYTPLNHGFDEDIPGWHMHGPPGSYLGPRAVGDITLARGEHLEERMAGEAVKFIEANRDHPFFLNYWAFSVHSPFVAKPELIEKYREKAKSLPPAAPHRNPLYAAMVQSLDEAVGRILDAVEASGIADRTIIVFTSDNGPETLSISEAGHVRWSNGDEEIFGIPITSNAPYKGSKGTIHEGGTRVPCIVVWPGKVESGSVSDAPFSSVDFFPTLLQMAGLSAAETPLDGISQVPALLGEGQPRDTLFGYWPNYPAKRLRSTGMRDGKPAAWIQHDGHKLICYFHDAPDGQDRLELYDLNTDPAEAHDLSAKDPARAASLREMLRQHHARTGALLPFPNPNYRPEAAASEQ